MGCGCHGDSKNSTLSVKSYDQCLTCARKHVAQAWQAWHEFTHEMDNRDFCSAELRACAAHCKYIQPEIAKTARDIAKKIELMEDGMIADEIQRLKEDVTSAWLEDNPDLADKLNNFKEL